MGKHSNGKMNWRIADEVLQGLRERLIWGGIGVVVLVVAILITETLR